MAKDQILNVTSEEKLDVIDRFIEYLRTEKAIPDAMPTKAEEHFREDLESIGIGDGELQDQIAKFFLKYFRSVGVNSARVRAKRILQKAYRIPFDMLIENNPEIKYQGVGQYLRTADNPQVITLRNFGKFELLAASGKKGQPKKAVIKFRFGRAARAEVAEKVKVIE